MCSIERRFVITMEKTRNKNKKQLIEEEIDKKLYEEADFEGKVDLVYYKALEHYEKKKTTEFLRDNNHDMHKLFNYKNGQLKKDIKKIKSKYYDLAKQTVEILESGDFSNAYKKGPFWYYYKKNSRAEEQRNRRTVNKRPKNISKDYTNFIYNKYTDKNRKVLRVLDKKRAEDLVWMLDYQFKIKFTILTFFVYGMEEALKAYKIEDIKDYILQGKIDLSRGIYANQIHHVDLCRKTRPDFSGCSNKGMYRITKKMIKRGYYLICYLKKYKNKSYFWQTSKLDENWQLIDFDRMTLLIEKEPQGKGDDCWNEDYDGRWLQLGKLTTREEAKDFEIRNHIDRPLKKISFIKSQLDETAINSADIRDTEAELDEKVSIYDNFSYERCSRLLETGEIMNIIDIYYGHLIEKSSFVSFKNQIYSCLVLVGNKLGRFYSKLIFSLVVRLARALNIKIEKSFLLSDELHFDFVKTYKEFYYKVKNPNHTSSFYMRHFEQDNFAHNKEEAERDDLFGEIYY